MSPTISKIEDERLYNDFYLIVYYHDEKAFEEREEVFKELENFKLDEREIKIINNNNINNIKVVHTAGRNGMTISQITKTKLFIIERDKDKENFQKEHKKSIRS